MHEEEVAAVRSMVSRDLGINLAQVLAQAADMGIEADDIYWMIASGNIYVDLRAQPLAEPERVRVFESESVGKAFVEVQSAPGAMRPPVGCVIEILPEHRVSWDGNIWTVKNVGDSATTLVSEHDDIMQLHRDHFDVLLQKGEIIPLAVPDAGNERSEALELIKRADQADLDEAHRRLEIIRPVLEGKGIDPTCGTPARTQRHWAKKYRDAQQAHGQGFLGLLPHAKKRGNRTPRLKEEVRSLMLDFIRESFETSVAKNRRQVYEELCTECIRRGLTPPSFKTFCLAVNRRPAHQQINRRFGPKAAYAQEEWHWQLTLTTPRHGDRPWQIAHIDHTLADLEVVDPVTGENLGRPWLTMMMDAYSRRVLAYWLTFDPPSYRSVMMVVRACVRRWKRMPDTLVVDGGKEFQGAYLERLLAGCGTTKKTRPAAKPRFGSVLERLFGTANRELFHNLTGNTKIMANVRQVTPRFSPKGRACWTLGDLDAVFGEWAFDWYDAEPHPGLDWKTPREAYESNMAWSGQRSHKAIRDDETFRVMTLPTTRKGYATVQPAGVKINYLYYWTQELRSVRAGTRLDVRYDPEDMGIAYVYLGNKWVECRSDCYSTFKGRSEQEVKTASKEFRIRKQGRGGRVRVNAASLAEILASRDSNARIDQQLRRDAQKQLPLHVVGEGEDMRGANGDGVRSGDETHDKIDRVELITLRGF